MEKNQFSLRLYGPLEYYKYIIEGREIHLMGDYHDGLFYQCSEKSGPQYDTWPVKKAQQVIDMANSWLHSKSQIINNLYKYITNLKSHHDKPSEEGSRYSNEYIISDWLALIAKTCPSCVDIFIERNISTDYFDEYGLGDFNPSYLISVWSIFYMCGKGDRFNGYSEICKQLYPSARIHDIDLRQFQYDTLLSEKITKHYRNNPDNILKRLTMLIDAVINDNSDYPIPFKYYEMSEKNFYDSMITLLRKQFNKSVFVKDKEKFKKSVLSLSVRDLSNYSWQETIFGGIQQYAMDIYLFCRLFIREDGWTKRGNNSKYPVSEKCRDSTHPKLSFVYSGFEHVTIYNKFIHNYFNIEPIISKKDKYSVRCVTFNESPINWSFQ